MGKMPELPEVETIRLALEVQLRGHRIMAVKVYSPQLRRPLDAAALTECCRNRRIEDVRRRGKYLIVELDQEYAMVAHLGMTGSFSLNYNHDHPGRHDHISWLLEDGRCLWYNDPRRFGLIIPVSKALPGWEGENGFLPRLGPEPLSDEFTADVFYAQLKKHKIPVKNLLLDQSVVAGLGNIYAAEALFMAGIDPRRRADRISRTRCRKLQAAIRAVLTDAIACGGTTISDYRSLDGLEGRFAVCLQVYGRAGESCPKCGPGSLIRRVVMGGRSTFYCPGCQS